MRDMSRLFFGVHSYAATAHGFWHGGRRHRRKTIIERLSSRTVRNKCSGDRRVGPLSHKPSSAGKKRATRAVRMAAAAWAAICPGRGHVECRAIAFGFRWRNRETGPRHKADRRKAREKKFARQWQIGLRPPSPSASPHTARWDPGRGLGRGPRRRVEEPQSRFRITPNPSPPTARRVGALGPRTIE